ncbi:MAG: phosphopantetheine-binding protein [bacterium]
MNPEIATHIDSRKHALARIREILIQKLHVRRAPEEIDPDTPLFGTGLRLDSIDAVELWVSVSVEFGFDPPEDDRRITAMRTLNTLADLVLERATGGAT